MEFSRMSVGDGSDALVKGDYAEALAILQPYAESGDAEAQSYLGMMYQLGLGIEPNAIEALKFLHLAVEQGRGDAAHNIGTLYLTNYPNLPRDVEKSKYWYRKARKLGFQAANDEFYL